MSDEPPEWFYSLCTWIVILVPSSIVFGAFGAFLFWKCGWPSESRCR